MRKYNVSFRVRGTGYEGNVFMLQSFNVKAPTKGEAIREARQKALKDFGAGELYFQSSAGVPLTLHNLSADMLFCTTCVELYCVEPRRVPRHETTISENFIRQGSSIDYAAIELHILSQLNQLRNRLGLEPQINGFEYMYGPIPEKFKAPCKEKKETSEHLTDVEILAINVDALTGRVAFLEESLPKSNPPAVAPGSALPDALAKMHEENTRLIEANRKIEKHLKLARSQRDNFKGEKDELEISKDALFLDFQRMCGQRDEAQQHLKDLQNRFDILHKRFKNIGGTKA